MTFLILMLLTGGSAMAGRLPARDSVSLAIQNVTLIDGTGAPAQPNRTILLAGARIVSISDANQTKIPANVAIVDGTGKFLIPGLWDMHVHTENTDFDFPSMLLVNGITAAREMGCSWEHLEKIRHWNQQIREGSLTAPLLWASGPVVGGPKEKPPGGIPVSDAGQGREAIIRLKKAGADLVKIYDGIPRDAYFAIADECKRQGLAFGGHVPMSITAAEASASGQRSLEHTSGFAYGCSHAEDELRRRWLEADASGARSYSLGREISKRVVETFDQKKAAALFATFARNRTWVVPTLVLDRMLSSLDDSDFVNDPRFRYAPPAVFKAWHPQMDLLSRYRAWRDSRAYRPLYRQTLRLIPAMRRAGVWILAGTDSPIPYAFPGFSLHDELQLLVQGGLTPMEALQTATRNPAMFLGKLDSMGTVEKGKMADLVLLDANPLDNITNTKRIDAIVVRGKLIAKAQREEILHKLESTAKGH